MDPTTPDVAGFDLLDWIETGTIARRTVHLYADVALLEEYHALEAALAEAEKADAALTDEPSLDEEPRRTQVGEVLTQMEDLLGRLQATRTTWTVRALSRDEVRTITDAHPTPAIPKAPDKGAPPGAEAAHRAAMQAWTRDAERAAEARDLEYIAAAVTAVESPKGTVSHVNIDALRRMRDRPHGHHRITALVDAVNAATQADVELNRPS